MFWAGEKRGRGELVTLRGLGVWLETPSNPEVQAFCSLLPRDPGILASSIIFSQTRSKGPQPSPSLRPKSPDPQTSSPQFMAHLWRVSLSPARGLSPISYHAPPPLGAGAGGGVDFPRRQSWGSQLGRVAGTEAGPSVVPPPPPSGMAVRHLLTAPAILLRGWLGLGQELGEQRAARVPGCGGEFTG